MTEDVVTSSIRVALYRAVEGLPANHATIVRGLVGPRATEIAKKISRNVRYMFQVMVQSEDRNDDLVVGSRLVSQVAHTLRAEMPDTVIGIDVRKAAQLMAETIVADLQYNLSWAIRNRMALEGER